MRKELDKLNNLRLSDIKAINKFVEMWEKSENNNLRYMYLSGSSARNVPYEDLDVFVVTERLPKVDPITKKSVEDLTRRDNTKSID